MCCCSGTAGPDQPPPATAAGRNYTMSIAVAASCVENAQNLQLATLLAGQVARAAAIYNVDEVRVAAAAGVGRRCCALAWQLLGNDCGFTICTCSTACWLRHHYCCVLQVVVLDDSEDKVEGQVSSAAALFARVLQFMETPQYLKK